MAVLIKNGTIVTAEGERKRVFMLRAKALPLSAKDCSQRKVMKSLMQRVNTFTSGVDQHVHFFLLPTRQQDPWIRNIQCCCCWRYDKSY